MGLLEPRQGVAPGIAIKVNMTVCSVPVEVIGTPPALHV
jgi:hypothetical protein